MTMTVKNITQELGFFEAISSENFNQIIIVCQNVIVNELNEVVAAHKIFTLNTPDGEEVYRTEDPQFFLTEDGTVLKKVGYCQTNQYSFGLHSGRRSQKR